MKFLVSVLMAALLTQPATPETAVNDLLAADRAFASAGAKLAPADAILAMFADDVIVPTPVPKPGFARGKVQATEALAVNPANRQGRLEWAPIRGGVSADGQHGFTVGYMTHVIADGKTQSLKYVAYWTKHQNEWRVSAYRRTPADHPPSSREVLSPSLPSSMTAPNTDAAAIARHRRSLENAEKAFSDDAQKIGLGPAFAKHGSPDAVNVGPRTVGNFVVGADAIGESVGAGSQGKPSPVTWAADEGSIVASSGDLGVTFGFIRQNAAPSTGQSAAVPFFTIWRRANLNQPWRYVAE